MKGLCLADVWGGMLQCCTPDTKAYVEQHQIRCAWGVCGAEAHNGPHMINIHEV